MLLDTVAILGTQGVGSVMELGASSRLVVIRDGVWVGVKLCGK